MFSRISGIVCGLVYVSASAVGAIRHFDGGRRRPARHRAAIRAMTARPLPRSFVSRPAWPTRAARFISPIPRIIVFASSPAEPSPLSRAYAGRRAMRATAPRQRSPNLNNPSGVAVDPNGDVLIADTSNNVVRIVVPSGIISTFAGNNDWRGVHGRWRPGDLGRIRCTHRHRVRFGGKYLRDRFGQQPGAENQRGPAMYYAHDRQYSRLRQLSSARRSGSALPADR